MHPQKRTYLRGQVQTESAIDAGLFRDLYVALGEPMDTANIEGAWALRLYYKPFIRWIWGGGLLMMLGGFTCAADRSLPPSASSKAETASTFVTATGNARMSRLLPFFGFMLLVGPVRLRHLVEHPDHDQSAIPSPLLNKPAPAFRLPKLLRADRTVSKADLLGKPYLLNVFASWCVECGVNIPCCRPKRRRSACPGRLQLQGRAGTMPRRWLAEHGNPYRC
jgi:hypothetical protein